MIGRTIGISILLIDKREQTRDIADLIADKGIRIGDVMEHHAACSFLFGDKRLPLFRDAGGDNCRNGFTHYKFFSALENGVTHSIVRGS